MSERYSKVFSLPENLYAEGAPVVIAAGALLKDNQTGRVVAQLKLRNISPKTIKAATVCLSPMNTVGNPLGDAVSYEYLDLNSTRDTDFGSKSAIPMPDITTRSFDAAVVEVIFTDNSVWNASEAAWEALKSPEALTSRLDNEMVKQFQIEYGSGAKNFFLEQKDLWHCVCGAVNRSGETKCHSCWKPIYDLRNIDLEALKERKEQRLVENQKQAAKEAAVARERKEAAIKTALKTGIIAVVAVLLIIIVTSLVKTVQARQEEKARLNAYNSAVSLIDAKQYDEAIAVLQELVDYKDSVQQIQIAEKGKQEVLNATAYEKAVSLLEKKDYESAVLAFEALGEYSDSAKLLIESKYQYALKLMQSKNYGKAVTIFSGLNDYADSKEMACECEYLRAMELIAQEDYSGAYSVLRTISEYKDAAEYLSHMYMVPQKVIVSDREYYYFGYNSDGKMNEAQGPSGWNYSFSEDGVLDSAFSVRYRERTYITASNGLVTECWEEGAYKNGYRRYDKHGNVIAKAGIEVSSGFFSLVWHECTGREYDEYANRIDHSTNVYGDAGDHQEMNLQSVCLRKGEYINQYTFSYTYLYSPNEEADMDLIWKNIRIICGELIWGYD